MMKLFNVICMVAGVQLRIDWRKTGSGHCE